MKVPSIQEILDVLQAVLGIIAEGGQKAIVLIILANVAVAIGLFYFAGRFVLKFIKSTNDEKEKALAAKDEIINSSRVRSDAQLEQFTKLVTQSIEKEAQHTQELRELRNLVTLFLTRGDKS
jgi:hypothetical protein